jgi:hypothetical protein
MAQRIPIVLSADGKSHEAMSASDVLPPVPVTTANTQTITLTGTGVPASALAANVNISTVAGNIVTTNATGVFATVARTNSSSITLGGNGTTASPIQAAVVVPTAIGQQLVSRGDGLFVPTRTVADTYGTNYNSSNSTQTITPVFDPATTEESMIYLFTGNNNKLVINLSALPPQSNYSPSWHIRIAIKSNGYTGNTLAFTTSGSSLTDTDGRDQITATYSIAFPTGDYYDTYDIYPFDNRRGRPYIVKVSGASPSVGAIWSYAFMRHNDRATQYSVSFGQVVNGSDYRFAGTTVSLNAPIPQGMWECAGGIANPGEATLFHRIS